MNLTDKFHQAKTDIAEFLPRDDRLTMLKLYSLYKQATEGDAQGKRPPITQMIKRVQWDAWQELKGTSQTQAMQDYINLVESLRPTTQ